MGTLKYARRERTIDAVLIKNAPRWKRYDVQIYDDPECKKPSARFMWNERKPKKTAKTIDLKGLRWDLVWIKGDLI